MGTKVSQPVYGNINTDGTRDMDRRKKRNQTPQHTGTNTNIRRSIFNITKDCLLACIFLLYIGSYLTITLLISNKRQIGSLLRQRLVNDEIWSLN